MKFPLAEINIEKYLDRIYELIEDDECQIFVDTNIFALFYRINNSARTEFFSWLNTLIAKERVKTPVWALNEYTNRFIRNQIEDYFGPLKKVKSIQSNFEELSTFLKMNIDQASLSGSRYPSLTDFNNDLDLIQEKLGYIKQASKAKDETYKLKIHSEIKTLFEQTVLKSNWNEILEKIKIAGDLRFEHKLPPGFKDGDKDYNSYGDVIIWNEILDYCESKDITKALLLTNDLKKDWVYSPNKIVENSKTKPNKNGQFKIIDPRLTFEFNLKTGSDDIYIISFDTLTQILLQNTNRKFIELAKALQIEHESKQEKDKETEENGNEEDDNTKIPPAPPENNQEEERIEEGEQVYSQMALEDRNFPLTDNSFLVKTIIDLKSHNWYVQNPAVAKFKRYKEESIEQDESNTNRLFVVGRNIYQAAQGGSADAVNYMRNLRQNLEGHSEFYLTHLFTGMVYEIYFNSENQFRDYNFKSNFIDEVYAVEGWDKLGRAFQKIGEYLEPYRDRLIYRPGLENIDIVFRLEDKVEEIEAPWGEEMVKSQKINQITANGNELLTDQAEDYIDRVRSYYYYDSNINDFIDLISSIYAIPTNKINNQTSVNQEIRLNIEPKRFKKL